MPYRFLEDVAVADVAFEAWGDTLEEMFVAAAEAVMNVMVSDLDTIESREQRTLRVESDAVDMLLFNFLQELVYFKDADFLLLRAPSVDIRIGNDGFGLVAECFGENIDPEKHDLVVDVKAVTLHRFEVGESEGGWKAFVILDI